MPEQLQDCQHFHLVEGNTNKATYINTIKPIYILKINPNILNVK